MVTSSKGPRPTTKTASASYVFSSASLKSSQAHLVDCNANISPGLELLTSRVLDAETLLKQTWQGQVSGVPSSGVSPSSSKGLVKKLKSLGRVLFMSKGETDLEVMHKIEKVCTNLLGETSMTSSRRDGYKVLLTLITSHLLPDVADASSYNSWPTYDKKMDPLTPNDRVLVDNNVHIQDWSYLDCSKYRLSGPKIVTLSQKTINFHIDIQDEKLKSYRDQLLRFSAKLLHHIVDICFDMRISPDSMEHHVQFIEELESVIDSFAIAFRDTKLAKSVLDSSWLIIDESVASLRELRSTRPTKKDPKYITEVEDSITLHINGKQYTWKKGDLTWKLLREDVLPSIGVEIIEVTQSQKVYSIESGYAEIFCGELPNGDNVALKSLRKSDNVSENGLCLRFVRELFIWMGLGYHPNIHKLLGVHFKDDTDIPAMVSPWCNDRNLYYYLRLSSSPTRKQQVDLALQVARGLHRLHTRQITHGDLKPDNILIDEGHAKLVDFGISRIHTATGLSTNAHGSYVYQAPEVLKALLQSKSTKVKVHTCATAKSDIYSFGNVLFECLTGQRPFAQLNNPHEISEAVLKEFKRPLNAEYEIEVCGEGREELIRLMKDCWHRDQAPRPSAEEVVKRLEAISKDITSNQ